MQVTKNAGQGNPPPQAPKPETKVDRKEERRQERVKQEAEQVLNSLLGKFLTHIIESDEPEGQETVEKSRQISAQWRLYCKRKALLPFTYTLFDEQADQIIKDYYAQKEKVGTKEPELEATTEQ